MRNIIYIALTFLMLSTLACEKKLFDYRNKYTGAYEFNYYSDSWIDGQGIISADSGNYMGSISYDKKTDDLILVDYCGGGSMELEMDKDGTLRMCGVSIGEINDDWEVNIKFTSNVCGQAGMGGGSNTKITGKKK